MNEDFCIFCKIVSGTIPVVFLAQNEHAVAFADHKPQAPVHILVVPRRHLININNFSDSDGSLVLAMMQLIQELAQKYGNKSDHGFKLEVNNGASAGQMVFHMHWHFLAGK